MYMLSSHELLKLWNKMYYWKKFCSIEVLFLLLTWNGMIPHLWEGMALYRCACNPSKESLPHRHLYLFSRTPCSTTTFTVMYSCMLGGSCKTHNKSQVSCLFWCHICLDGFTMTHDNVITKTLTHLHATKILACSCPVSINCLCWLEQVDAINIKACWSLELCNDGLHPWSCLLQHIFNI